MRFILAVPLIAVVMVVYAAFIYTALAVNPNLSSGSLFYDTTLPSEAEFFLTFGDVLVLLGLVAFFFEVIKAARLGPGTVVDHMLSTVTFVIALVVFLLVPLFGTASFLILTVMAFIDVVAGFTISIFSARRDYSVNRDGF
ncbi:hypothetical protein [Taklimakanibacter lacteus]|uniref:hypothetical protein n=1 Tax=Taklimakanibacter lacteus TaxID=2268456 RepID=UPI000E66AAFE